VKVQPDGRFHVEGVPAGRVRVWASGPGFLYSYSDPVEITARCETTGVEITLEPKPGEHLITGIVVTPEGQPCPDAWIEIAFERENGGGARSSHNVDDEGRFTHIVREQLEHTVIASDPENRFGASRVERVAPGVTDLVVRLTEPRTVGLIVRGPHGEIPEKTDVDISYRLELFGRIRWAERFFESYCTIEAGDVDAAGAGRLLIPAKPFKLKIRSPGYSDKEVGPFQPGALPDPIRVDLELAPCISGRVVAGGLAQPGTRLTLHAIIELGETYSVGDFACRSELDAAAEALSESDGNFRIDSPKCGEYYLRAEKEGFALFEIGPLHFEDDVDLDPIEVVLGAGGSIEGYVVTPPGQSREGLVVAASRGDAFPVRAWTGSDGHYLLTGLTPGRCQVEIINDSFSLNHSGRGANDGNEPVDIPWNCKVEEGGVTRHDIDIAPKCYLAGRLSFDRTLPYRWSPNIHKNEDHLRWGGFGDIAADGSFRLEADEPDTYYLIMSGHCSDNLDCTLRDLVTLVPGVTPWSLSLTTGNLAIKTTPSEDVENLRVRYEWSGGGTASLTFSCRLDEQGRAEIPGVPVGLGILTARLYAPKTHELIKDYRREVEVQQGGTTTITLD